MSFPFPSDIETLGLNTLIAFIFGIGGFFIRSLWESYSRKKDQLNEIRLNNRVRSLRKSLKNFYWPIYTRLCIDIIAWQKAIDDELEASIINKSIERQIILPNHKKIVRILEKRMYQAKPDAIFNEQILLYIKYVSLYLSIRESGDIDTYPADHGCPFPQKFLMLIEKRTLDIQQEYNELLGLQFDRTKYLNKRLAILIGHDPDKINEPIHVSWKTKLNTKWHHFQDFFMDFKCRAIIPCNCRNQKSYNERKNIEEETELPESEFSGIEYNSNLTTPQTESPDIQDLRNNFGLFIRSLAKRNIYTSKKLYDENETNIF